MKKINCILLVDDNAADNVFHKIIVTESGICNYLRIAIDGLKGLEYIENSAKPGNENEYPKPDLILLDINMPRMNGFEFLEKYQILDEKVKSGTVIAILTTSTNPVDQFRTEIYKCVVEFLNKPLTTEVVTKIAEKYF